MVSKRGKSYDERVSVDLKKRTETFHMQKASSGKDKADIIYDFKNVCKTKLMITY